ncbi:MAG: BspA family leucine-rich repeat surface protein [Clostridia bacterium]|nr:BspA family leucine-rich repeat surface protein [Clostridia bacterium]
MKKYIKKAYFPKFLAAVLISILIFFLNSSNFFALDDYFSLCDVSVQSKSESAEVFHLGFEENKITLNAEFHKPGDYITYKIKIKNDQGSNYIIKSVNSQNDNEYVKYEHDKYENIKINSGEEKEFLFTAKYFNGLNDISKRNQSFYSEFVFSLEDESGNKFEESISVNEPKNNPLTGDNINKYALAFLISFVMLVVFFIYFFKKSKSKRHKKGSGKKFIWIFLILALNLFLFVSKAADPKMFKVSTENHIDLKDKLVVTYNIDENSEKITVNYGENLNLDNPIKSGYKFENWLFDDGTIFDTSKPVLDDISITANFRPSKKAKFKSGPTVNKKMKELAGNSGANKDSDDFNILKIKKADDISDEYMSDENIVSSDDSDYKIYIYLSDGVMYYYSQAEELYLNQNSSYMFNHLKNVGEIDTEFFNTSEVTNMELMFYECNSLKSLNLNNFNTKNVEKMRSLFSSCKSIEKLDLSSFDTKNVTDMSSMFNKCSSLREINISGFNTEKVTDMNRMFSSCESVENLDLSNFNTRSVRTMEKMFDNMYSVKSINFSDNFGTENVSSMLCMFRNCYSLESVDLSGFGTSSVMTMEQMFYCCHSLISINFGEFTTPQLTNTNSMFSKCESIKSLDLSSFNTSAVTSMKYMFNECLSLEFLNLSGFNTENVTDMNHMFSSCEKLQTLNLSNFNTRRVENMEKMFDNMYELQTVNVSSFDTGNVINMKAMFRNCVSLVVLDLFCFDTHNVENMQSMFEVESGKFPGRNSTLTTIYAGDKFTTESVVNGSGMFKNDVNLVGGKGTVYSGAHFNHIYARIDGGETSPGYFSSKEV